MTTNILAQIGQIQKMIADPYVSEQIMKELNANGNVQYSPNLKLVISKAQNNEAEVDAEEIKKVFAVFGDILKLTDDGGFWSI